MKRREMLISGAAVGAATLLTTSATAANEPPLLQAVYPVPKPKEMT